MSTQAVDTKEIVRICTENDAIMVGLFGSAARGDTTSASDIDLLVRFARPKSLLDLVKLERKLSASLNRKIDLLTEGAISPYLRDSIMAHLKVLYEAQ